MRLNRLIIFILILGVSLGILGYYYYRANVYSREILRLEILGQEQIEAFEEIEYLVKYKNNGSIALEEAQLIFQYPEDALPSGGGSLREIKELEDIYPGQERTISFKARLLGREGESKKAEATIRYRPKNLKAFFEASTTFTSKIQSVPLTFEMELPSRVEPGREIQLSLNYFSNSDVPITDLRVQIEYPAGFEFISATPEPLEKTEWLVPLLNKAEGGRIEVNGKISGSLNEQKVFRASMGMWQQGKFILLREVSRGAEIIKPSLAVFQLVNGSTNYVASAGELLHYEVFFRNIGQEPFQDLFLVAKLESPAFDFDTLRTELGQFNKGDNFILWDWREISELKFLEAGKEGKVEFWINLKQDWERTLDDKNFALKNEITISQARERFETKVNSRLEISQKGYFKDEVFGNSGPFPQQVGQTTTYTVVWEAKNHYNDVQNATARAVLPGNVRLTGRIWPEDASLTFDSASREVLWSLGELPAGAGINKPAPLAAFQVAVVPESQTGVIVGEAKIRGEDSWTGVKLEATDVAVTSVSIQQ